MIRVWSDSKIAGRLDRHDRHGATFAYAPDVGADRAISLTMPVRLASWDSAWGIHPIFEMNLPEGYLREKLRIAFAKATGSFDNLDLLAIVGRSQIGRLRYTAPDADLEEDVPFQSVDEILRHKRDGDLFDSMIERFATYSGISGVQPKVMIRDEAGSTVLGAGGRASPHSFKGATHIVKFADPNEYPGLPANEYFCLLAAEKAGLPVKRPRLSDDGSALVIDRFDLRPDGSYLGMEDFCVLNAKGTDKKYDGGYEANLFKRLKDFVPGAFRRAELEKLFTLFVLNAAVRNGDAHLKNFALIYDEVTAAPRLSDVYDIVTTTVYIPKDAMALTLDGTTRWPERKQLTRLGTLRCGLAPAEVGRVFDRVGSALSETLIEMDRYIADNPNFAPIGNAMAVQWRAGVAQSLSL